MSARSLTPPAGARNLSRRMRTHSSRTLRSLVALVALVVLGVPSVCVLAPPAVAGESDAALQRRAREAYDLGLRHYKVGDFTHAIDKFKEAYVIRPDPSFLFNIGQAYRQLGDASSAIRAYRNYLKDRPAAPNRADVEAFIRELEAGPSKAPPAAGPPPALVEPAPVDPGIGDTPPADPAANPPPPADPNPNPAINSNPDPNPPPPAVGVPPPALPDGIVLVPAPPPSRLGLEVSAGFSYRYLYEASFLGAQVELRVGSRTDRAKLFYSLRVFGGQGLPGLATVTISSGFVGQGRIGRVYLGGGAHAGLFFASGPVTGMRSDQTLGASLDLDVAVMQWGRRELLVGVTGAVDLLLGSQLGTYPHSNQNTGIPVMATGVLHAGFGF